MASRIVDNFISPNLRVRQLSFVTLFIALGAGVFSSTSFAALVQDGDLSSNEFSTSLAIGGVLGVVASPLFGSMMDRGDVYKFAVLGTLLQAISIVLYVFLDSFPVFILAVSIFSISSQVASIGRGSLIALSTPKELRSQSRGYSFTMANIGISIGSLMGALLIFFLPKYGSRLGLLLDSVFIIAALLLLVSLGEYGGREEDGKNSKGSGEVSNWRNWVGFSRIAILVSVFVLGTSGSIVTIGFASWLYGEDIGLSLVGVWLVISTILVACIHVAVSGLSEGRGAATVSMVSGGMLFVALAAFGVVVSINAPMWLCIMVATLAVLLIGSAGSFSAAAGWSMSYSLASEDSISFTQGVFNAVFGLGAAAAAPLAVWGSADGKNWVIISSAYIVAGFFGAAAFNKEYSAIS